MGVCAAAVFLLKGQLDAAFVAATIGVVSWFLSYRVKMKQILDEVEKTDRDTGEDLNENADN